MPSKGWRPPQSHGGLGQRPGRVYRVVPAPQIPDNGWIPYFHGGVQGQDEFIRWSRHLLRGVTHIVMFGKPSKGWRPPQLHDGLGQRPGRVYRVVPAPQFPDNGWIPYHGGVQGQDEFIRWSRHLLGRTKSSPRHMIYVIKSNSVRKRSTKVRSVDTELFPAGNQ